MELNQPLNGNETENGETFLTDIELFAGAGGLALGAEGVSELRI